MNKTFLFRLALSFAAAGLIFVALAYYWLDNMMHELVGTGMFLLVIAHNIFHRRWYGGLRRPPCETRTAIDRALVVCLLVAMAALLVTSVMISQTVFSAVAMPDSYTARRIHVLAAHWVLILVAIHLGIRWRMILAAVRNALGVRQGNAVRTAVMRLLAVAGAAAGLHSSYEMGIFGKLIARMSLEWWDFGESTIGFFLHHIAIMGLFAFLGHYAFHWLQQTRRPSAAALARRV